MPWVGFEPTMPASDRTKTVHAPDRSATVTGNSVRLPTPFSTPTALEVYFCHSCIIFVAFAGYQGDTSWTLQRGGLNVNSDYYDGSSDIM
jgi:hypothetical protein